MDFFKTFRLQLILLCFASFSFGQIETGKVNAPEKKEEKPKEKEKKVRPANYDPSTVLYLGGNYGSTFRSLKPNTNYFGKPLGERGNEVSTFTGGFGAGMRTKLVNHLFLDFGLSMAKNGESYDYKTSDSSYRYKSTYMHFAVPIKLMFTTGGKVRFMAGVGIQPQMFIRNKQHIEWTNTKGIKGEKTIKETDNFNLFTISAIANVGVEWQFAKNASLYLLPEIRTQLNSSYGKQAEYIHKGSFFGAQLGMSFVIN